MPHDLTGLDDGRLHVGAPHRDVASATYLHPAVLGPSAGGAAAPPAAPQTAPVMIRVLRNNRFVLVPASASGLMRVGSAPARAQQDMGMQQQQW
jgi:hypothetical protein